MEPPLFAGSILGVRSWKVVREGPRGEPRLGASFMQGVWEPGGGWTEARCRVPDSHWPPRHRAPAPDCMCGLYAYHPHDPQLSSLYEEEVERHAKPGDDYPLLLGEIDSFAGVIEARGRIEVHGIGFRAERARPLALIVGPEWPRPARHEAERLARIYRAKVIEVSDAGELGSYCCRLGGLDPGTVEELLEVEAASLNNQDWSPTGGTPAWGAPPPSPPAAPPAPERSRLQRALGRLGEAVVLVIVGTFMLFWYGMWAAVGIMFLGALLFGWLEEEQKPLPARVAKVRIDPERCMVSAVVTSKRPLKRLELRVTGRDAAGEGLGHLTRNVGLVAGGRSTVRVAVKPSLCRAQQAFTVRVRAVFPSRLGRVAEVSSKPRQKPPRSTTESVS